MDEGAQAKSSEEESSSLCSPKPLAFTIDFGEGKSVDLQRHQTLVERYKNRHKRGQSLSKIETKAENSTQKKHPSSANLPRKSSFQSDGYFSSDEKSDRSKTIKGNLKRDLSLQLKNVSTNKMTQSFPSTILSDIMSPEVEIKDISSPELDLVSPLSPEQKEELPLSSRKVNFPRQHSSPESATQNELKIVDLEDENFVDGTEFDFDRSDTVSDTGTYTLDADNYSEAQKLRMSIDREFKIEQITGIEKTQEYIRSLASFDRYLQNNSKSKSQSSDLELSKAQSKLYLNPEVSKPPSKSLVSSDKLLSPILSPTQNLSITETVKPNGDNQLDQTFTKIMIPSEKSKRNGLDGLVDRGSVISVTSSGVFRSSKDSESKPTRKLSLTKSEIQVEAYVDESNKVEQPSKQFSYKRVVTPKLSANVINVQNISVKSKDMEEISDVDEVKSENVPHLPPAVGGISGKNSPTKIPSPINTLSRPRSRNSLSSQNVDLSDSSIETESYLKSTQSCINSLQKRLSLDSDQDSDLDNKYGIALNNTAHNLLKQKASHTRHNSLDGRGIKISNKLEHFQSKNLQGIDQTYINKFNQCAATPVMQKIQNSPNNSPIRRSSSFSLKNQINLSNKNINVQKEFNYNDLMQRSTSSAYAKSGIPQKPSVILDHPKIDRNKFGDTESSSEEDFEKNLSKKKDTSLTNTRYNRAFSLRRGRLDSESSNSSVKCPNTPEIRRKFQPERGERAISVDRKPRPSDVQSRYMTNMMKKISSPKLNVPKNVPKTLSLAPKQPTPKAQVMSRTDSGRFSMRVSSKGGDMPKSAKKDSTSGDVSSNENIGWTYVQLSRVINAKNDIINNATKCAGTFNENAEKIKEMELMLRKLRCEMVFNPIQERINIASQEDAVQQRKSAEHIYRGLQKTSLSINVCEENELKVKEELKQFEELLKTTEDTLNKAEHSKKLKREKLLEKADDVNEANRKLITSYNELKFSIENKTKYINNEESNLRLIENQVLNKQIIIQRSSEIYGKNIKTISDLTDLKLKNAASFDKYLDSFKKSEEQIEHELADLVSKADDSQDKLKEIQEKLILQRKYNEEYNDKIIALKNKKVLLDTVQIQKKLNDQGQVDLAVYNESITNREKILLDTRLELKNMEDKKSDIATELNRQKEINEHLIQEKNIYSEKKKLILDDIEKTKIELDILQKANKEKEETIKTLRSEEEAATEDKKKAEANLAKILESINKMNETISQLQTNIENTEKKSKASEILQTEKENKQIDVKTIKYLKSAENLKKRRAKEKAEAFKKKNNLEKKKVFQKRFSSHLDNTDSSQDSLIVSKRNRMY